VAAVAADLRDPAAVLADQGLWAVIDLPEPVGEVLGAVLLKAFRPFTEVLPPGQASQGGV
jgi:hypothetical protein